MFDLSVYNQDPRKRWESAKKLLNQDPNSVRTEILKEYATWPKYWWGVANAWLVFLGPSPGNSAANPINWEVERLPTLGEPHSHFVSQRDSTGFWPRMREWTAHAFSIAGVFVDDESAAIGSTLLANVLDTKEGDARRIEGAAMELAMPNTVDHLFTVRPRIIVPMEKRISELLIAELKRRVGRVAGPRVNLVPALNQRYDSYKPKAWTFETSFGPLLVAESPQHPSKRNFYDPREVDRYLANQIQSCL